MVTRQRKFGALSTQKMDMRRTLGEIDDSALLEGALDQSPVTVLAGRDEGLLEGSKQEDTDTVSEERLDVVGSRIEPESMGANARSEISSAVIHGEERTGGPNAETIKTGADSSVGASEKRDLEGTQAGFDGRRGEVSGDELQDTRLPPVSSTRRSTASEVRTDRAGTAGSQVQRRRTPREAVKGARGEDALWREVVIAPQAVPTSVRYSMYLDEDVYEAADRDRIERGIPTWREYFIALLAAHAHELDDLFPSVGYDLSAFGIGVVSRRGYRRHEGRTRSVSVSLPRGEQGLRIAELIESYAARAASKSAFAQVLVEHHLGVLRR